MLEPHDIAADDQDAARFRDRQESEKPDGLPTITISGPELQETLELIRRGDGAGLNAWVEARFREQEAARKLLAELDD